MTIDSQLNVYNFQKIQAGPKTEYAVVRLDTNNNCNLRCVYCHNHRSDDLIDLDEFRHFLQTKIIKVDRFQVGCIMEPTLDKRLADFILAISESPARPVHDLKLQTNGILLHRHNLAKMNDSGLTQLSVSLDSVDPAIQKNLRSGTSLNRVQDNVTRFMSACPAVKVEFITTVTRENIQKIDDLIISSIHMGVHKFIFREVVYYPRSDVVDHQRMPDLVLQAGEFDAMRRHISDRFGGLVHLVFADNGSLRASSRKMVVDSKRSGA